MNKKNSSASNPEERVVSPYQNARTSVSEPKARGRKASSDRTEDGAELKSSRTLRTRSTADSQSSFDHDSAPRSRSRSSSRSTRSEGIKRTRSTAYGLVEGS